MSFRDLAIECLERGGLSGARHMGNDELLEHVFSREYLTPSASFPAMLDMAVEKAYKKGHKQVPVTFDKWTTKGSLNDFKKHDNYYIAGPVGNFELVPEGGELKHDVPSDAKLPQRFLRTWGKSFTLSRQAIINDDIGLVTSLPARYAQAARRTINTQCYQRLMSQTNIYDEKPLFCADHKNLMLTGTDINADALQNMIMALSTQKDQFGQSIIIRPAFIIVPVGYGPKTFALFRNPTIHFEDNTQAVNPFYGSGIEVVEDPTINSLCGDFGSVMPWWLVAASGDCNFIEVEYLNGREIPNIRRSEVIGQLGLKWDIFLDWNVTVLDYRGAVKNPGVAVNGPFTTSSKTTGGNKA